MMDANSELLTYIHKNAEMGKDTISHLMTVTNDIGFKTMLQSQFKEYNMVNNISEKKLTKATSYLSINLNTLVNKTPSHLSEMIIQGSTMGVIDITKKINEYQLTADKDVMELATDLLSIEQRNIDECKKYLQ
jgi:hypothetical protein